MVASDRISAFDFVLDSPIPDKGQILTRLSLWWFERLADLVPTTAVHRRARRGRAAGRGVRVAGDVPGRVRRPRLPRRLRAARLPRHRRGLRRRAARPASRTAAGSTAPIFTPATKAALGEHDENVSYEAVVAADRRRARRGAARPHARRLRAGGGIARGRGIVLADAELEFGARPDGTTVLGDEVLTPDSSRFWPAEPGSPGARRRGTTSSTVRDWLSSPACGWDRHGDDPPPPLPTRWSRSRARTIRSRPTSS